ncbi:MAG TPA: LLM class flavin-dependent oxidoreductase [Acidimicrobiia bacterium]|nr:LLM class flavin-dependent oxidoreductase [Acidimicrobiia bacterium]
MDYAVQTRGDWDLVLTTARWAEERGLVALALPDHYLERGDDVDRPAFDHLIHLAALARETTSLELVCLLSPVTFRHPAVYYKMGVTLDEVSGGRFTMGIGTGWLDEEFDLFGIPYPDRRTRFELLEECMGYLSAAVAPGGRGFTGKHYRLAEFDPRPHPRNLRLLVGGAGMEKTPRIAGRHADEFNIYACPPDQYSAKRDLAAKHAADAGRDPGSILFSTASPAIAARDDSDYRRLLGMLAKRTRSTPERIEQVYEERGYPHGSGSKPSEMLAALGDAGCERFYPQMFLGNPDDFDTILDAYRP